MVDELVISAYEQNISTEMNDRLDQLEAEMRSLPQVKRELNHWFFPGLYLRQLRMQKDTMWMSRIHDTEHPFVITQGSAYVKENDGPWQYLQAPYFGKTMPGTRRVLIIPEMCVWTTTHVLSFVTGEENNLSEKEKNEFAEKIMDTITEKHSNPYVNCIENEN